MVVVQHFFTGIMTFQAICFSLPLIRFKTHRYGWFNSYRKKHPKHHRFQFSSSFKTDKRLFFCCYLFVLLLRGRAATLREVNRTVLRAPIPKRAIRMYNPVLSREIVPSSANNCRFLSPRRDAKFVTADLPSSELLIRISSRDPYIQRKPPSRSFAPSPADRARRMRYFRTLHGRFYPVVS
jgi:hypothetical protein